MRLITVSLLLLPTATSLSSPSSARPPAAESLKTLRAAALRPKEADAPLTTITQALAVVSNAGIHPESWTTTLAGTAWVPFFSAKPAALKAASAADYPAGWDPSDGNESAPPCAALNENAAHLAMRQFAALTSGLVCRVEAAMAPPEACTGLVTLHASKTQLRRVT